MWTVQRVSVVGNSGSGKSTLGRRIAAALDSEYVELDAINHQRNWTPLPAHEFTAAIEKITANERWVIDGNYRAVVVDGPGATIAMRTYDLFGFEATMRVKRSCHRSRITEFSPNWNLLGFIGREGSK